MLKLCIVLQLQVASTLNRYKVCVLCYKAYMYTTYTLTHMCMPLAPCRQVVGQHVDVKLPPEFKKAWEDACKTKSRCAKNLLFNKWLESGVDWGLLLNSIFPLIALLKPGNTISWSIQKQFFQELF